MIQEPQRSRSRSRAGQDCEERYGELVLYTRWALDPNSPEAIIDRNPDETEAIKLCRGDDPDGECAGAGDCWWIVDVCGREIALGRDGEPAEQFTRQDVNTFGAFTTKLRGRVKWMRSGLGCQMDFDIGTGVRLGIEGADVQVEVLGPRGNIFVSQVYDNTVPSSKNTPVLDPNASVPVATRDGARDGVLFANGIILSSVVTGQVVRCYGTNADKVATLTQTFRISEGEAAPLVPLPSRAKQLVVSQPGATGLVAPLTFFDEAQFPNALRDVYFDVPSLVRSTSRIDVPQNAQFIQLGGGVAAETRDVTLQWILEL